MRLARLLALALLAFSGCASNSLDGSLSEAFDLSFSSVMIRRSPKALQVSYLRSGGDEVVARLTVVLEGVDTSKGFTLALDGDYAPGHPRAAVSRAVDNEPVRQLPPVERGTIELHGAPEPGKTCSGSFSLSFGEGGDLGAGRSLNGSFVATVEGTAY